MNIENILQELGYSQKEALVYKALLELGTSPVSTIGKFIWENRVTVYSIVKNCIKKWLIVESNKNNISLYTAIHPNILLQKEENKFEKFKNSLPDFLYLLNQHSHKPKMTFYEWLLGIKNLISEVIKDFQDKPNTELYCILWAKNMDKEYEDFLKNSLEVKKTKPKETPTHVIIIWEYDYWYANYCREKYMTKTVEKFDFPMEHEIIIYENKVAIVMYKTWELSWVILESTSLADGLRAMFQLIWKYVPESKK